ncbi:hypothetical protein Q8A67_016999 [Cirrhinus molitorella]|uniref:Uncharacterized protein n=1 Tax=Cirrhinus molitorella TaxID=172907 RepID=A0AA88PSS2_9TELE|nr:hypothetical protein Q8A67_016999 [Cirrhinus molitorella]
MKLVFAFVLVFVLVFSVAVCDIELALEATEGEKFHIPLQPAELERATRVIITFKRGKKLQLIEQFCNHDESCTVKKTPGFILCIENRTLTLQHVSSNTSGLYEVKVLNGKDTFVIKATVVTKPAVSLTELPLHTSTPKPPNSSERQRLHALLILPVILVVVVSSG